MGRTYTTSISRTKVTLNPSQMAALASEFCGWLRSTNLPEEYIITFTIKANYQDFLLALDSFQPILPPSGAQSAEPTQ